MTKISSLAAAGLVVAATLIFWQPSYGEDYYYPGGISYHASTAAEGYMRGMGAAIRSKGQYNLDTSAAAINMTQAQKNEMENRKQWTETYFQMRAINRDARAQEAGPRPTQEDMFRYAQQGAPARLSPSELDPLTGKIQWPSVLQVDAFAPQRAEIEAAFADRAKKGTMGFQDVQAVQTASTQMFDTMKANIQELPPQQYLAARNFLQSLPYEAGKPAM